MRISLLELSCTALGFTLLCLLAACSSPRQSGDTASDEAAPSIELSRSQAVQSQLAKYARHEVNYDKSLLDGTEQQVLDELIKAAGVMDELFLEQVWSGNVTLQSTLIADSGPEAEPFREFFRINYGPFDRLEHNRPFIGDEAKPPGANFYPEDLTREEFESWVETHREDREALEGTFTVVRREEGALKAVPYSEHYVEKLRRAADHLRRAAELSQNASLSRFLNSRADAFLSNDYYQSDMDWMDIEDNIIDVTIGPYEVYEDSLFNYKAAFEAFICLKDPAESARLASIKEQLPAMEENLPIRDEYKNKRRGTESPISVVDVVVTAGDCRAGVQTLAFNLPNDERVREAKGSKKVLLKNIMQAKYEKIYIPIAQTVLQEGLPEQTDFEAFFNHTLMHEIAHGLGPGIIHKDGRETTVAKELMEYYSAIEEAKADTLGVFNTQFMADRGLIEAERADRAYITFLGGIFRSVRFGVSEAHGKANIMILNYLLDQGGYFHDPASGRFGVDLEKARSGFRNLASELLTLEAEGDYDGTAAFIERYGAVPLTVEKALGGMSDIAVDIDPLYRAHI